jgi:hypothetical protein
MTFAYREAGALAAAARLGLGANALVAAAAVIISLTTGPDELILGDLARPFALVQLVTELGSLILFLVWFYRANANARAMGADGLMGSPGLSVAWFFIPIAFLFMPYVVVRDTWKASAMPRDWQGQPTAPLVGFWWAAMLATHVAGLVSFRLSREGNYDLIGALGTIDLIANLASLAASGLGMAVVTRIQALQVSPAHLSDRFS